MPDLREFLPAVWQKKPKNNLTMVKESLSQEQMLQIIQETPPQFVKVRPGKGGKEFNYVEGGYIKKLLNRIFGFTGWSFEVVDHGKVEEQIWVKGRLTIKVRDEVTKQLVDIVKEQFGSKEIAFLKGTDEMLSYGDDLKSAATDAFKKCANALGIADDVYCPQVFEDSHTREKLKKLNG